MGEYCPKCHRGIGFWDAPDESPCDCARREAAPRVKAKLSDLAFEYTSQADWAAARIVERLIGDLEAHP